MTDATRGLLLGLALLALAPGCNFVTSGGPDPETSTLVDGVYHNAYFGFSLPVPPGWSVASEETRRQLQEVGSRALAGGDGALRAELEAAAPRSHTLIAVFQHPLGTPVPSNPNWVVTAEEVSHLPGIESHADYLALLTNTLGRGALGYERLGEPHSLHLGGREFEAQELRLSVGSGVLQRYLVRREGDYGLALIASAPDEAGLDALTDTLRELRWD